MPIPHSCPACESINPLGQSRCDCGYDLSDDRDDVTADLRRDLQRLRLMRSIALGLVCVAIGLAIAVAILKLHGGESFVVGAGPVMVGMLLIARGTWRQLRGAGSAVALRCNHAEA